MTKMLFGRYEFSSDGLIFDLKMGKSIPPKKKIYLIEDKGKGKEFNYLRLYYELFSGQKLKRGQSVGLRENTLLKLENIEVYSSRSKNLFKEVCEDTVINMYKNGKTLREIAFFFHTRPLRIASIIRSFGINPSSKNCFRVPYRVNHSYFSKIDSHEKAYLLGVLFADGCVMRKSNQIHLISNDYDLLEFFKEKVGFTGDIQKNPLHKRAKFVAFSSIDMKKDLIKLGCVPSKSLILEFPNIDDDFFWSFLLGYFDGDGSLWVSRDKKAAHFKIMSCTLFCNKLREILAGKGFVSEVRNDPKTHKKETSYIRISSKKTISKIFPLLYSNAQFFLKRKRDKFLEALQ